MMSWKEGKSTKLKRGKSTKSSSSQNESSGARRALEPQCFSKSQQQMFCQTMPKVWRSDRFKFLSVNLSILHFCQFNILCILSLLEFFIHLCEIVMTFFLYLKYISNVNLLGSGWVLGPFEEWLSQHACHPLSFLKEVTRIYQRRRTSPTIVKYAFF